MELEGGFQATSSLRPCKLLLHKSIVMSKSLIQKYYTELFESLTVSEETLLGLTASCYQANLIDLVMKAEINNPMTSRMFRAGKLLELLELKLKHSEDQWPKVLELMDDQISLNDIVKKMRADDQTTGNLDTSTKRKMVRSLLDYV